MRNTMMPPTAAHETPQPAWMAQITPTTLAAFEITDTDDLFSPAPLAGENTEETAARWAAAADVLDDRLVEIAHTTLTAEVVRGWAQ